MSSRPYGIRNFRGRQRLVRTDVQTPGYMRAPFEHISVYAMESVVDEIAYATGRDPVAIRLANDTMNDPVTGSAFLRGTSQNACGAARSDLAGRTAASDRGSMRAPDGTLIGWGVAIGAYPASAAPAIATLSADAAGRSASP